MKAIMVTSFALFVTSCSYMQQDYFKSKGRHSYFSGQPLFMANLPQGDDSYSQGVRDGCNTAVGQIGSGYLRSFGMAYDPNRGLEDQDYYMGYRIGNNYCTYYLDPDPL